MSKALSGNGAKHSGKEAAREHGMELARGSERAKVCSKDFVARAEVMLSRVNVLLSRQCLSEYEVIAWLISLMDGVSLPKPSARTSAEVEYTSEPSQVRFRECDDNED